MGNSKDLETQEKCFALVFIISLLAQQSLPRRRIQCFTCANKVQNEEFCISLVNAKRHTTDLSVTEVCEGKSLFLFLKILVIEKANGKEIRKKYNEAHAYSLN
jgi:hypothetical protein